MQFGLSHTDRESRVFSDMNVGEAMGTAMVKLLKGDITAVQ